jgi:hypothetical protein
VHVSPGDREDDLKTTRQSIRVLSGQHTNESSLYLWIVLFRLDIGLRRDGALILKVHKNENFLVIYDYLKK